MTDLRTRLLAMGELGPSAILHYATYRAGLVSGLIRRRTPVLDWERRPFEGCIEGGTPADPGEYAAYRAREIRPRFFFDAAAAGLPWPSTEAPPRNLLQEADEILDGRFRLFGGPAVELGDPPDWFAFPPPLTGRPRLDSDRHWSEVPLDEDGADVRLLWEPSRFGWVFPLARAYRWTGEAAYAEACWKLIDDWRRANPPNRGIHWASAQEVGLRILALAFAERAFFPAWSLQAERLQVLAQLVAFHAARIPPTLSYAQAQGNNHLLSEAAGLHTAGLLFPELRESARWRSLGHRLLGTGFERQVFPDGGYVQHSTNYQRLALGLGVWSARLAELNGEPLPERTLRAIARLARSLAAQADPESGLTPSFGPDDGSDILPLSTVECGDVRPINAAASRLTLAEAWYGPGPWDESSLWLGIGMGARAGPPQPDSLPETGLHYLQGGQTRGSLRCVEFRERPGHSDQLHVDLWWRGRLVAFDPGSYLYNGPPPWQDGLASAAVHNAPMVDGQEPMRRAGRFLWTERARGLFEGRRQEFGFREMSGVHHGYRRLGVVVSRSVALFDDGAWLVEDAAHGTSRRRLTVGWNLPDLPWQWLEDQLRLSGQGGGPWLGWGRWARGGGGGSIRAGLVRAGEWIAGEPVDGPVALWGWSSPRYSVIEPCLRLVLEVSGDCPLGLSTRVSPGGEWPERLVQVWHEGTHPAMRSPGDADR